MRSRAHAYLGFFVGDEVIERHDERVVVVRMRAVGMVRSHDQFA